ncbi:hypothetical protein [Heyndrickxia ginsengihumi]|nr:hypothetical protein [Heyndrickxia ginsengihumi]
MYLSKRMKKKMMLYSYMCKKFGIINEEDYHNVLTNIKADQQSD